MASDHLGDRVKRLRRLAGLTQEGLAEKSGVSVDVVRKLEQQRKHSARLPTLHALAKGLGVELTALLGDPPAVPSTGAMESPELVSLRRAITPFPFAPPPEPDGAEWLSLALLRSEIADGWSLYHAADFGRLIEILPGIIADARLVATAGRGRDRLDGHMALGKALQLSGHLAIRLGKTDLGVSSLERATAAADIAEDPLLAAMVSNSMSWAYQRQNRLDDSRALAVHAADAVERDHVSDAMGLRVWGGLIMAGAISASLGGDYDGASEMLRTSEKVSGRLALMAPPADSRMVSIFSKSSVQIKRVRLAVQHARSGEALSLAKNVRFDSEIPPSWRAWLFLDVARAHADLGDAAGAVAALERLQRTAPGWMRYHTLAVGIVSDLLAGSAHPPGLWKLARSLGIAD
ncbi:helix-turn-helix domain-containing protein [Kitasatospora sp. NPDC057940]|uniref:helix-turn-helix domain-containing protein n=1 Tax=Kitasatospora sp. NPDC057940 TaxID=3346285 RepID=UPI0036DBBEE7